MSNEETEIVPIEESVETTIEESETDILRRERDEFTDIALRVQADFE
ncbi:MAG: hypothetical protein ACKOPB_00725 [Actinomycetota bacterium]